jgi:ABC-2 type transport system permease protein
MTTLRYEWRILRATNVPWLVAVIGIVASALAIAEGLIETRERQRGFDEAAREQQTVIENLRREVVRNEQSRDSAGIPRSRLLPGTTSPAAVQSRLTNFTAALPPLPTAVLSQGLSGILPQRYQHRSGERFTPFERTADNRLMDGLFPERSADNPSGALMGDFDLAFIAVYIYPLLILILTYNVVSADRESGTLALISAQPLSLKRWLAARLLIRATFFALTILFPPVMAAAVASGSLDSLVRLAIWLAAVSAYSAFWFFLAGYVSSRASGPAFSATVLACLWLALVIVVPAAIHLSEWLFSIDESQLAYVSLERAASLEINPRVDAAGTALRGLLRLHPSLQRKPGVHEDDPWFVELLELPVESALLTDLIEHDSRWSMKMSGEQLSRALVEARRIHYEKRLASVLTALTNLEKRRDRVIQAAQFASPALLLKGVIDEVAGTGIYRWKDFIGQMDNYIREQNAFFTQKVLDRQNVYSTDFKVLAPFVYREEPINSLLTRIALPFSALVLFPALSIHFMRARY